MKAAFNSPRVLLEPRRPCFCILGRKPAFNSPRVLLEHRYKSTPCDSSNLSILPESYWNAGGNWSLGSREDILSILPESYWNFRGVYSANLIYSTFNSPRVLLERIIWSILCIRCGLSILPESYWNLKKVYNKLQSIKPFQFSQSLIGTMKFLIIDKIFPPFQFSQSLIGTRTGIDVYYLIRVPFNSPRVLLEPSAP